MKRLPRSLPSSHGTSRNTEYRRNKFIPNDKKAGGRYVTVSGKVKKLDGMKCAIIMTNGTKIPIGDVRYIDGDMFRLFE